MNDPTKEALSVDLFVEDRAHEEIIKALLNRLAQDESRKIEMKVRSARGGHGKVIDELKNYQDRVISGVAGLCIPDILVIAIDTNCHGYVDVTKAIRRELRDEFKEISVLACQDPHVEIWYMADPDSFFNIVGSRPAIGSVKCVKDRYKQILASAVLKGGNPPTLGGIEFARDLAAAMDLHAAGRSHNSLRHFVSDLRNAFKIKP